jgi:hypothetical protein
MKKIAPFLLLISIALQGVAQDPPLQRIGRIKNYHEHMYDNRSMNQADSLSKICANNYVKALEEITSIYKNNSNTKNLNLYWQKGATDTILKSDTRNKLIAAILNTPDALLAKELLKNDLVEYVPAKQTECCAIAESFSYKNDYFKNIHPLVLTALSVSSTYQSHNGGGGTQKDAIMQGIGVAMVDQDLQYSSKNGYQKNASTKGVEAKKGQNPPSKEPAAKKQPIVLWLVGGFVIAVILYFLIGRRQKG